MFKKALSTLLIVTIISSYSIVALAANGSNGNTVSTGNTNLKQYEEYLNKNSFPSAEKEIALDNSSISGKGGKASEKTDGVVLNDADDSVTYTFKVNKSATYNISLKYYTIKGYTNDGLILNFLVDGAYPYSELSNVQFPRLFKQEDNTKISDEFGNELSPQLEEHFEWQTNLAYDSKGFVNEPLKLALKKGEHTVTVQTTEEAIKVGGVTLLPVEKADTYANTDFPSAELYNGEEKIFEAEAAEIRSDKTLVSLSDRSSASVFPNNPYKDKINFIGGNNWNSIGQTITWYLDVPETAFYRIAFNYKQNYVQEGLSYRSLYVDGKLPFKEAESVGFEYTDSWKTKYLDEDIKDGYIYLEKGRRAISLKVTLGALPEFAAGLQETVEEMGIIYRKIATITGEKPDTNRDYALFTSIPELEDKLTSIKTSLDNLADLSEKIAGSSGGSNASVIRKASNNIKQMLKVKYKAHTKIKAYYDNYSSLSSWLFEMQSMPLDIDSISLLAPNTSSKREGTGFFTSTIYSIKRLMSSFVEDYLDIETEASKKVVVWCGLGRDQVNIINRLISESFTPETGLKVDLKISGASLIQANLSGRCPDVSLLISRSSPVDYGMRGVLYDLSKFDDFDETVKRFAPTATVPYTYKGGVYGLPSIQNFYMMFVRTDIFEEYGLEIPKTWDDFLNCAQVLYLNKMQVALPYSPITNIGATNVGVGGLSILPTLMLQKDISLYNADNTALNFDDPKAIEAITMWTDFYKKYNFPKTYSFFNRFRIGMIPLAIESYTNYIQFSAAAPEITDKWVMVPVPGFEDEKGNVNNYVSGSGNADVVLKNAENPEGGWEFLKWWSSADVQTRYSSSIETILGVSGRHATANIEALSDLGWDKSTRESILYQSKMIREIPEIPGSYYVSRSIDQIYWNVVDGNQNLLDTVDKWGKEANNEIIRKTKEYSK